jgi:hypothetical protein
MACPYCHKPVTECWPPDMARAFLAGELMGYCPPCEAGKHKAAARKRPVPVRDPLFYQYKRPHKEEVAALRFADTPEMLTFMHARAARMYGQWLDAEWLQAVTSAENDDLVLPEWDTPSMRAKRDTLKQAAASPTAPRVGPDPDWELLVTTMINTRDTQ